MPNLAAEPFNRVTTPLELLVSRRSGKARDLAAPCPDAEQLDTLLRMGTRVPDHGKLAPWRIIVVAREQREAFATGLVAAYSAEKPEAGRLEVQAMRDFALQAPTLLIVLSTPKPESHIPLWEQELSVGALCQNLLLAGHAHGFLGNWLTGWPAYSPSVLELLGAAPPARVAGFLFFGSCDKALEERPRPDLATVVSRWSAT